MIEFITFVVGVGVGGAAVWFFKNKALVALEDAKQEVEKLVAKGKKELDELKDKIKKDKD
jgi:uncharacterized membrane-anchored protein YhcB (DUF1043 family)